MFWSQAVTPGFKLRPLSAAHAPSAPPSPEFIVLSRVCLFLLRFRVGNRLWDLALEGAQVCSSRRPGLLAAIPSPHGALRLQRAVSGTTHSISFIDFRDRGRETWIVVPLIHASSGRFLCVP